MAFQFNSTDLGILADDPGKSIGAHYYLLVMSRKIQKYLSSYYINLDISKKMSLPTEKTIPHCIHPVNVWNQLLQFGLANKLNKCDKFVINRTATFLKQKQRMLIWQKWLVGQ